jgi:hypothetical protein
LVVPVLIRVLEEELPPPQALSKIARTIRSRKKQEWNFIGLNLSLRTVL